MVFLRQKEQGMEAPDNKMEVPNIREVMNHAVSIGTDNMIGIVKDGDTNALAGKNTILDYAFLILLLIAAMFFPFEAFLIWLGTKLHSVITFYYQKSLDKNKK